MTKPKRTWKPGNQWTQIHKHNLSFDIFYSSTALLRGILLFEFFFLPLQLYERNSYLINLDSSSWSNEACFYTYHKLLLKPIFNQSPLHKNLLLKFFIQNIIILCIHLCAEHFFFFYLNLLLRIFVLGHRLLVAGKEISLLSH